MTVECPQTSFSIPKNRTLDWSRRLLLGFTAWTAFAAAFFLHAPNAFAVQRTDTCNSVANDVHWVTIDCSPGFATAKDLVRIYRRGTQSNQVWPDPQDYADSVWIFDPGEKNQASLIIDFHQEGSALVADLFDDGDGDGIVSYRERPSGLEILENKGKWTVQVTAPDGWWTEGDRINYNLDILVDGPVIGNFHSGWLYDVTALLQTDGKSDFEIHVRDTDMDGQPDYEWRQDRSPLPEDPQISGHPRTDIIVNSQDDEQPIRDFLFWPYLSHQIGSYNKNANGLPPIQVDWTSGKIRQVSEFIMSRSDPGSYSIYSIVRVKEGQMTQTDFENPIAFYDLAEIRDGWHDLTIRFGVQLPYAAPEASQDSPLIDVQYAWDQQHDHTWDYQIGLSGWQEIDEAIHFPEFSVRAIPPKDLPDWITERNWDAATFVQVEKQPYWSSEFVYEWHTVVGSDSLRKDYLSGVSDNPQTSQFSTIPAGFRGEYALNYDQKPYLYYSPIDHKLHLFSTDAGIWSMDGNTKIKYANLDGDPYLDQWTYNHVITGTQSVTITKQLAVADTHLIFSDDDVVVIRQASVNPSLFETEPPRNREEWEALGNQLDAQKPEFAPDDFLAMLRQFDGPEVQIHGATVMDYRPNSDGGFRFVLEVTPGYQVSGSDLLRLDSLSSGEYLVENHAGVFSVSPLVPAQLSLTLRHSAEGGAAAPAQVTIQNTGAADAPGLTLVIEIVDSDGAAIELARKPVDVLAGEAAQVPVDVPSTLAAGGSLRARLEDGSGQVLAELEAASLAGAPNASRDAIFGIGQAPILLLVVGLFAALVALAALLAITRKRGQPST